jgi:hypothetical protein
VALRDPADGEWIDKRAASTFFPDAMSDDEVPSAAISVAFSRVVMHTVIYFRPDRAAEIAPRSADRAQCLH